MSGNVKMMSADAVSAKMAECYVTIKDVRYNFMQMLDFEAKIEKKKTNVPILGRPMDGCLLYTSRLEKHQSTH